MESAWPSKRLPWANGTCSRFRVAETESHRDLGRLHTASDDRILHASIWDAEILGLPAELAPGCRQLRVGFGLDGGHAAQRVSLAGFGCSLETAGASRKVFLLAQTQRPR